MNQAQERASSGPHQRKLKNYLLDRRFQVKYANLFAGIALLVSAALAYPLWTASSEMIDQSRESVELGKVVLAESRKVSQVVQMNIVESYKDDPILRKTFEADAKKKEETLNRQQASLEAQAQDLARQSRDFGILLISVLIVLVAALWFAGIWITHKVAGPVYKMKRQLKAVEAGNLEIPSSLRKGDELKDFFDAFRHMVRAMRDRQHTEIAQLEEAIQRLADSTDSDRLKDLVELRDRMKQALGPSEAPPAE